MYNISHHELCVYVYHIRCIHILCIKYNSKLQENKKKRKTRKKNEKKEISNNEIRR